MIYESKRRHLWTSTRTWSTRLVNIWKTRRKLPNHSRKLKHNQVRSMKQGTERLILSILSIIIKYFHQSEHLNLNPPKTLRCNKSVRRKMLKSSQLQGLGRPLQTLFQGEPPTLILRRGFKAWGLKWNIWGLRIIILYLMKTHLKR
jgi:hypothetical protein